jgi:gliding motility-associated lipoprotein GldH
MRLQHIFIFCLSALIFSQCSNKTIYSETVEIPESTWSKDDIIRFSIPVTDTNTVYSLTLDICNNEKYQYSNLYLFTNIIFPDNTFYRDTIEFILANNQGEWIGDKSLSSYTNTFLFRQGVKFPETGTYIFSFEQAMRCKNESCSITGIKSLSLSLIQK